MRSALRRASASDWGLAQLLERVRRVHRDAEARVVERDLQRGNGNAAGGGNLGVLVPRDRPEAARGGAAHGLARLVQRLHQEGHGGAGLVARERVGRLHAVLDAHAARFENARARADECVVGGLHVRREERAGGGGDDQVSG